MVAIQLLSRSLLSEGQIGCQGRLKEAQKAVDGVNMVDPGVHPVEVLVL
jgi:hypothetical protein